MKFVLTVIVTVPGQDEPFKSEQKFEGTKESVFRWLRKRLPVNQFMFSEFERDMKLEFSEGSRKVSYLLEEVT